MPRLRPFGMGHLQPASGVSALRLLLVLMAMTFGAAYSTSTSNRSFLPSFIRYLASLAVHANYPRTFIQRCRISRKVNPFATAGCIGTFADVTRYLLRVYRLRLCQQR
jgi:hypothetical protein